MRLGKNRNETSAFYAHDVKPALSSPVTFTKKTS